MAAQAAAPAASGRVARRRDRRIREIVAVAAELFGAHGYDGVSLEDVAERLDLTKGSLYHYFAGKDELVTAAIETLGNEWTDRLERLPAAQEGPVAGRLRALLREHMTIAVREYPAALGLFLVPQDWPAEPRARIKALRRRHDQLFRRLVEEGVASGELTVTGSGTGSGTGIDTVLRCMHAAMSQSPVWCARLRGRARDRVIDETADALMMLVGIRP